MARASLHTEQKVTIEYGSKKVLVVTLAEAESIFYALKDLRRELHRVDV